MCYIYYIYAIIKAKCCPVYHRIGFAATHALGHDVPKTYIMCHSSSVATKLLSQ